MLINQFDIWLADLNPRIGTEPGKTRPVVILQTDLLNRANHPSTIVCPLTTNVRKSATILRVHLKKGQANLKQDCDIMLDQIRTVDNNRLIKKIGILPFGAILSIRENLAIILDT